MKYDSSEWDDAVGSEIKGRFDSVLAKATGELARLLSEAETLRGSVCDGRLERLEKSSADMKNLNFEQELRALKV